MKFTVKSTTDANINGSEAKKRGLRYRMCQKSYVNTTSHKYVARPESQQREELHIRTLQTATPLCSSVSVSMEQSINTFSEGNIKKRIFTCDKVEFAHYICPKKPKN